MNKFVVNGPQDTSGIPHKPIGKLLMDAFSTFDKNLIAVVNATTGDSLTYSQLCQMSKNLATSLRLLGVSKGDIVGLMAENSAEFLVTYLAGLFIAVPVHLINSKHTPYELEHILGLSEPSVLICTKKTHQNARKAVKDLNYVTTVLCLDVEKMLSACVHESNFQVEDNFDPEEQIALICNSSGTTGLPKGVMINHEMLRLHFTIGRHPDLLNLKIGDRLVVIVPFFHIYGMGMINAALFTGTTIIPVDAFEPDLFLKTVQNYKTETLLLVPTLVNFFIKSPLVGKYDLSSVKRVVSAGDCLPEEDARQLINKLSLQKLEIGYGLTESGIAACSHDNPSSIGKVLCGYQMKVVDLEKGHSLPPFQNGEICIKGQIMKGYLKNSEKTKEMLDSEGFLHSGDVGYYDDEGYFYISGRMKDLIKHKSCQVAPVELEQILSKFEGIKDVAVIGKPDSRFGELPTAAVVKEQGVEITEIEICEYLAKFVCDEKRLHGGVRFVDDIPRTNLGKIRRQELMKQLFNEYVNLAHLAATLSNLVNVDTSFDRDFLSSRLYENIWYVVIPKFTLTFVFSMPSPKTRRTETERFATHRTER
ncbi:luciferin 4-monooxygenase-like [Zophobas morio]|uniref:luciferin 4-monooxygenase-like n=1 Tax=Zophobas morio TaxID=2755281 RepID=UPI0030832800